MSDFEDMSRTKEHLICELRELRQDREYRNSADGHADRQLRVADEMRKRNVKSYTLDGVTVEFFPAALEAKEQTKDTPDVCRCGHGWDEHHMGLCISKNGGPCDPLKCSPEPT